MDVKCDPYLSADISFNESTDLSTIPASENIQEGAIVRCRPSGLVSVAVLAFLRAIISCMIDCHGFVLPRQESWYIDHRFLGGTNLAVQSTKHPMKP